MVGLNGRTLCFPYSAIGNLWANTMYVDGVAGATGWSRIPTGSWGHVHLEAKKSFSDDLNIMSRTVEGAKTEAEEYDMGCMAGRLAEV